MVDATPPLAIISWSDFVLLRVILSDGGNEMGGGEEGLTSVTDWVARDLARCAVLAVGRGEMREGCELEGGRQ